MLAGIFVGFIIYAILDVISYCALADRVDHLERQLKAENDKSKPQHTFYPVHTLYPEQRTKVYENEKFKKKWWERGE